jgi:hypothetical protein
MLRQAGLVYDSYGKEIKRLNDSQKVQEEFDTDMRLVQIQMESEFKKLAEVNAELSTKHSQALELAKRFEEIAVEQIKVNQQ